ncbi:MAG: lactonase family protein [Kiritimatiellae bacterium]|jgi:6-phosphogluconolactonase|nr:lactonase family protein [Kiritimatiellia bacterium]
MKYLTYIGTYTNERKEGIHIFESDTETGEFTPVGLVGGMENPTYLNLNKDNTLLYASMGVTQLGDRSKNGALAAYAVKGSTLKLLNFKPVHTTPPCYVQLDKTEKSLIFAEYTNAVAGVFELNADGSIADSPPQTVTHEGSGPNKKRQDKAHAHCAEMTPDNKYICIVDLGLDSVKLYNYANRAQELSEVKDMVLKTKGGAGPRHITFHANGKLAFLINELDNTLSSYSYTGDGFTHIQTLNTLPADFIEKSTTAAVKINAAGDRVFASNRGHDSIVTYGLDAATGKMERMAISKMTAPQPRDFELMPGEKFALAGSQSGNSIQAYAYDAGKGIFTPVHKPTSIHMPVCVKFGAKAADPQ